MDIIAYIVLALAGLQLLSALLNLLFPQKIGKQFSSKLKVSVLIPARNEANNIGNILRDLSADKELEIIIANDNSEDDTLAIIETFQKKHPAIRILNLEKLPEGWKGKNFACDKLAAIATGDYYLFLDADVRVKTELIHASAAYMEKRKLALLSIFPTQDMKTAGEWATVPIMHQILLSLLPLVFVRYSPFKSHVAANGQFMLFKNEVYKQLKPHEHFRNETVEDIRIAHFIKKSGFKLACITGEKRIQCRMYHDYQSAISGFAKNIRMFFKNSFVFAFFFWLTHCFGILPFLFETKLLIPYIAVRLLTLIIISTCAQQSIIKNLFYFIPQCYALSQLLWLNLKHHYKPQLQWKGRSL